MYVYVCVYVCMYVCVCVYVCMYHFVALGVAPKRARLLQAEGESECAV
jgi:hypothetical protein